MSIQKMKKFFKSAAVTLVTAAMCFGAVSPVMAETGQPITSGELTVTNELQVATGVTVPEITYNYTITPVSKDGDTTATNEMPTITLNKVTYPSADENQKEQTIDFETAFTESYGAGVYVYKISQSTEYENADGYTLTSDATEYTVEVYVKNAESGTGVTVASLVVYKSTDGEGDETKLSQIDFVNTLTRTGGVTDKDTITITKSVPGDYADHEKAFPFTIKFEAPTGFEANATISDVTVEGATLTSVEPYAEGTQSITFGTTYNFELKHEDSIAITGLPYGTKYTVVENLTGNDATYYKTTADTTNTGGNYDNTSRTLSDAVFNDTLTNDVTYVNSHDGITPTGFLIDNMPFILLIVIGAAGIGAYIISRRRHYQG